MENKLRAMFDYQRFEPSSRLARLIQETESRYAQEISDDDLSFVAAAGEPEQEAAAKAENPDSMF